MITELFSKFDSIGVSPSTFSNAHCRVRPNRRTTNNKNNNRINNNKNNFFNYNYTNNRRRSVNNYRSPTWKLQHFTLFFNLMIMMVLLHSASCLEELVCGGFDMRNSPTHFLANSDPENIKRFNVCTVIEGDVRLILMTDENLTVDEFEQVRFPNVKEITGSLMVFQVTSLKSLQYLFPELRVIRGNTLVHNYALVLFQNPHLREVGLPKLVEISRGGVRIVDNAELCYSNTINWTEIIRDRYTPPFIDHNQSPNTCADRCEMSGERCAKRIEQNNSVTACWNFETCQQTCPTNCTERNLACNYTISGVCCHEQCIGGCSGPTDADCYACRNVHHKNRCISECPNQYYKVLNRRCITKEDCHNRKPFLDENNEDIYYKALDVTGTCEMKCPENYEENPNNKLECVQCPVGIGCTKKCMGVTIQSIQDAEGVKGCNIMHGALDITMHTGLSRNVVEQLEEYLGSLREVRDYVKISFTPSLVSLSMLKNLRLIRGEKLWNDKYAISVFENVNLAQLWNFTREREKLQILHGTLQFHNNPQLCYNTIIELASAVNLLHNITEHDVSPNSNGNKAVCEELEITLKFVFISADSVVLNWEEFNTSMMDHRMFLGYQLYYKTVTTENVNIFENRDACSDSWNMIFYDTEERGALLTSLKPHTLYAFYVRTLMVNSPGAKGGISKVVFGRTKFDPPSPVLLTKIESTTYDTIYLEWDPPSSPNGEVTHYMISYVAKPDVLPRERNYCYEPVNYLSVTVDNPWQGDAKSGAGRSDGVQSSSPLYPLMQNVPPDVGTCSKMKCCDCAAVQGNGSAKKPTDDAVFERANFENTIHNIIFVNNRCTWKNGRPRCPKEINQLTSSISVNSDDSSSSSSSQKKKGPGATIGAPGFLQNTRRKKRSISEYGGNNNDGSSSSAWSKNGVKPRTNTSIYDFVDDLNSTDDSLDYVAPMPIVKNHTGLNFTIQNLRHFTSYEIKIWACQNDSVKDRENYCSRTEVTRLKRTRYIVDKDEINVTSIKIMNQTSVGGHNDQRFITWTPPDDPNGVVVSYEIEYSRDQKKTPTKDCVTVSMFRYHKGYMLSDLLPGNYTLQIRALSLAAKGPLTPVVWFIIPEPYRLSDSIVILVAIVCSLTAIGLGIVLVFCVYRRQLKKKLPEYLMSVFSANPEYISQLEVYKPDEWELKRDEIELVREIGRGTFGTVYEGRGANVVSNSGVRFGECAVKTVGERATIYDRWHFLIEASVMKQFNTAYVVKLYGVVSEGQPALVVMEMMSRGNLKEYLISRRPDSEDNIYGLRPPTLKEVLQMSGEIADGMAYLEMKKFCHRDLAARNCMVSADGTCKIGDFGMARDVYIKDYYRPMGRRLMPVRWMAPEALKDATFTSKSDVWSYGIVLWEIATLASQPYPGLSTEDVFSYVVDSRRVMEMPVECPQKLYSIMQMCWKYDPKDRVNFSDLVAILLPDLNDTYRRISYYCTQRGKEQTHRSATTTAGVNSTRLSPTAVNSILLNENETETVSDHGVVDVNSTLMMNENDCVDPTVPFSVDSDDVIDLSQTPIIDGIFTDSDAETAEPPVCNNNRRIGIPKSYSSPNWNNSNNRRSPVEMPLTPTPTDRRSSNGVAALNGHVILA